MGPLKTEKFYAGRPSTDGALLKSMKADYESAVKAGAQPIPNFDAQLASVTRVLSQNVIPETQFQQATATLGAIRDQVVAQAFPSDAWFRPPGDEATPKMHLTLAEIVKLEEDLSQIRSGGPQSWSNAHLKSAMDKTRLDGPSTAVWSAFAPWGSPSDAQKK